MTGLKSTMVVRGVGKGREREMAETKPHKWAEVIKAWADGKPIQVRMDSVWVDYVSNNMPPFNFTCYEFRVKPENIVIEGEVSPNPYFNSGWLCINPGSNNNIRLEFDHDTKKLVKAEVIR